MIKIILMLMYFLSLHLCADQNLSVDDIYNQLVPEEKTRGLTIEKKTIDIHSIYFDYNSAKLKNESIKKMIKEIDKKKLILSEWLNFFLRKKIKNLATKNIKKL